MLKNKKIGFYFNNIVKLAAANPIRMALTAAGIFISVLLFSLGLILSNSLYRGTMRIASLRSDNSLVLDINTVSADIARDIKKLSGVELTPVSELHALFKLCSLKFEDKSQFTLAATIIGMYPNNSFLPIIDDDGNLFPVEANLISGRLISAGDIRDKARVAVIDRYTADILFPSLDPIGQVLYPVSGFMSGDVNADYSLKVVGVVEPTLLHDEHITAVKKQLRFHEGSIMLKTFVYCPMTAFETLGFVDSMSTTKWIGCIENDESYERTVAAAESLEAFYAAKQQPFSMNTKESFIESIEKQQSYTKTALGIGMAVLCIISGISIMSIAMFSVKERVAEIGIRKAFGATGTDIALQIILEMMLLSIIVSIVAVCISFFISKGVELYATRKLLMNFSVSISNLQLLLPVFTGCLTSFLCSLLPAIYAAKLNVTNALKFE